MLVILLANLRNKDCKTTVRIVTCVETLGSHLKGALIRREELLCGPTVEPQPASRRQRPAAQTAGNLWRRVTFNSSDQSSVFNLNILADFCLTFSELLWDEHYLGFTDDERANCGAKKPGKSFLSCKKQCWKKASIIIVQKPMPVDYCYVDYCAAL